MQRCCVEVVANAEQLRRIDTVFGVKGEASGLHGPLDGGTGDIAGACGFTEGELGHDGASASGLQALFDAVQDAHAALKEQRVLGEQLLRPDGILRHPLGALVHLREDLILAL
jgi:hypothetical protein